MKNRIAQLLDARFDKHKMTGTTNGERALFLDEAAATYSKILNGTLKLTLGRSGKWATKLESADQNAAGELAIAMVEAAEKSMKAADPERALSIDEFWAAFQDEAGALPAERISELFLALRDVEEPLICCEYRDIPRAGPGEKYWRLGEKDLAEAIKNKLCFAMFQPFIGGADVGKWGTTDYAAYMLKVRDRCRSAYEAFHDAAREVSPTDMDIDSRLQLYEPQEQQIHFNSGFQSRIFYVQYKDKGSGFFEQQLLQWATTPFGDLLILRDKQKLDISAVRDSFYPVVHYFDRHAKLPKHMNDAYADLPESVKRGLPPEFRVWNIYREEA